MNWLQSILYGFVSGLTEFIPVSSRGHQAILLELFGQTRSNPILDIFVHIAVLAAVISASKKFHYQLTFLRASRSGTAAPEQRLIKTATVPMLIGVLLLTYLRKSSNSLLLVSVFCLLNGIILFVPGRMLHGNKDARSMSALDGILAGLAAALSALPGISRVGAVVSVSSARGADYHHGFNWEISLSIPALAMLILIDIFNLFTAFQPVDFLSVIWFLLAAGSAYAGTHLGIRFMKIFTVRVGFSAFAYYSWGAALFAFVLYLI